MCGRATAVCVSRVSWIYSNGCVNGTAKHIIGYHMNRFFFLCMSFCSVCGRQIFSNPVTYCISGNFHSMKFCYVLGKQIGFSQLYFCGSPSHNFMIFCISVVTWQCQMAIYATYLITLRTEGQVLCLAKHHSTEHRELVHDHPSCDWSFKCVLQWKLEFPQRPCGRPSLHHLKYCAYVKIAWFTWPPASCPCAEWSLLHSYTELDAYNSLAIVIAKRDNHGCSN